MDKETKKWEIKAEKNVEKSIIRKSVISEDSTATSKVEKPHKQSNHTTLIAKSPARKSSPVKSSTKNKAPGKAPVRNSSPGKSRVPNGSQSKVNSSANDALKAKKAAKKLEMMTIIIYIHLEYIHVSWKMLGYITASYYITIFCEVKWV